MKAIKRNQSVRRGEGVMKRVFGDIHSDCYLVICLKSFQFGRGKNTIRIAYRQQRELD